MTLSENKVIDICFCNSTVKELNDIIEEELNKEDADLELVDECCKVLELINECVADEQIKSKLLHTAEEIVKKYNSQRYKKIFVSASCAVLMGIVVGATVIGNSNLKTGSTESLKGEVTQNLKSENVETTSHNPTNGNSNSTTAGTRVKRLKVMQPYSNASLVFDNRSSINLNGFYIYVELLDGNRYSVVPSECQYEVLETAEDGLTRVKVTYDGFETFITVTVRVSEITTTEYFGCDDCDDCWEDDFFDDDYKFTEEEVSATIEETEAHTEKSVIENTEAN